MGKYILVILILVLSAASYFYISTAEKPENKIEYIQGFMKEGKLVDFSGAIEMNSIEDLSYRVDKNKINIYYGKVQIILKEADLLKDDIKKGLSGIGITYTKIENEYTFYYKGQAIKRVVSRS